MTRDGNDWNAAWIDYRPVIRKRNLDRWRMFDFDSLPRETSILDVGAGCGDFLEMLRGAGFTNVMNLAGGLDEWSRTADPELPRYKVCPGGGVRPVDGD